MTKPQLEMFAAASTAVVPISAGGLFMAKYEPGSMTHAAIRAMIATKDSISIPP